LWPLGTFCGRLVYLFPFLVCCTEKNLATLPGHRTHADLLTDAISAFSSAQRGHSPSRKVQTAEIVFARKVARDQCDQSEPGSLKNEVLK
jgi:hypothetical protein